VQEFTVLARLWLDQLGGGDELAWNGRPEVGQPDEAHGSDAGACVVEAMRRHPRTG